MGILKTPIHTWPLPRLPGGVELWIKRDDLTGCQLSGNKVRKLEFLMAEALEEGCNCVVTIGGSQSNHCRATAVAARYAGMEAHLLLRTSRLKVTEDPGLVGNLLVERLIGANIYTVSKEDYVRLGSKRLGEIMMQKVGGSGGNKPYFIPVGGSNSTGTWGYVECFQELMQQAPKGKGAFTDIVMACGSGGTAAGLAIANEVEQYGARVWAYGVCDTPREFYDKVDELAQDMGFSSLPPATEMLKVVQAKGAGYSISREEELQTIKDVAVATGVCLDPTYSGKALHGFLHDLNANPDEWRGRKVCFLHTGGLLSMYEKADQLLPIMDAGKCRNLELSE